MNPSQSPRTTRLLDRLAHDLRGPLTPLQTASYLLRSGQVEGEQQQELLAVIERQTRRLAQMIEELGDWSRIGQARLLGPFEPCDPALLLDYARTDINTSTLTIVDDADAAVINGDPVRLTQLLKILIEYANARGSARMPTVSLRIEGPSLRIDVRDIGPVPDQTELATLFEEPQPEPYDEGLGLRLLIACAIAQAHGGSLVAMADDGHLLLRCELPLAVD